AKQSALHQDAVGRQQNGFEPDGFTNSGIIANVGRPVAFITGRAQPAGKTAKPGIAEEARSSRTLRWRLRQTAPRAIGVHLIVEPLINMLQRSLRGYPKRSAELFGFIRQPGNALVCATGAHLAEECTKCGFVCLLDSAP